MFEDLETNSLGIFNSFMNILQSFEIFEDFLRRFARFLCYVPLDQVISFSNKVPDI